MHGKRGFHPVCRSENRQWRTRTCVRRGQCTVRNGSARPDQHPAGLGLVLRLSRQRFDCHRIFPHASERYGNRRSFRHHGDAGDRGRPDLRPWNGKRSSVRPLVICRPHQRNRQARLLQCAVDPLWRHSRTYCDKSRRYASIYFPCI